MPCETLIPAVCDTRRILKDLRVFSKALVLLIVTSMLDESFWANCPRSSMHLPEVQCPIPKVCFIVEVMHLS